MSVRHLVSGLALLIVASCANPSSNAVQEARGSLTVVGSGYVIENIAPGYWTTPWYGDKATLFLSLSLKTLETLDIAAFDSIVVTAPGGTRTWAYGPTSAEVGYKNNVLTIDWIHHGTLLHKLPLGDYRVALKLKNGAMATESVRITEPGSLGPSSNSYVTTQMPLQGETTAVALATGLTATRAAAGDSLTVKFTVQDTKARNAFIWFYNGTQYLGTSRYLIGDNAAKHPALKNAQLVTDGTGPNEVTIDAASVGATSLAGLAAIKSVTACVVVVCDGAQYAPSYTSYDYRSRSERVTVR